MAVVTTEALKRLISEMKALPPTSLDQDALGDVIHLMFIEVLKNLVSITEEDEKAQAADATR